MDGSNAAVSTAIAQALSGEGAHVPTANLFDGLSSEVAGKRPPNASHSIYELLSHICFWQDWGRQWFAGMKPAVPRHASGSWPEQQNPKDEQEWEAVVHHFQEGLQELEKYAACPNLLQKNGTKTRLEMLHALASHASYHAGQVVAVRQMLQAWPPPSGGLTW